MDDALRKAGRGEGVEAAIPSGEIAAGLSRYGLPVADFTAASPLAESYRTLRTNLQRISRDKSAKSVVVASAARGEGRTQTVANLAVVTSAVEGIKTLVIDADLRHPQLHLIFEVDQAPGLSNFLQGAATEEQIVRLTQIGNLHLVPSGDAMRNPSELFHSPLLGELMEAVKGRYDTIFFDSAPVIPYTDSVILATKVDGILLVTRARQTRREVVRRAKDLLNKSEEKFLGVVFNRVEYVIPQPLYQKL